MKKLKLNITEEELEIIRRMRGIKEECEHFNLSHIYNVFKKPKPKLIRL